MCRALGDDFPPLFGHQVQKLVNEEGRRQGGDAPSRDSNQLTAYRAPENKTKIVFIISTLKGSTIFGGKIHVLTRLSLSIWQSKVGA